MITCCLTYRIDPFKIDEFEAYGRRWMPLVDRFGGVHHGYYLPSEGANNVAMALFSFPSLARYEEYRAASATDPDCIAARNFARETRCFLSLERTFFRPLRPCPPSEPIGDADEVRDFRIPTSSRA